LNALNARLHRRQRAGLRERRTLRAAPVEARATRRGPGTQPAPGGPVAGLFIADFLAPSIKLIVEVDDAIHERKQLPDARRDRKLQRAGFRIVRVSAELVLSDLPAAVALVRAAL